MSTINQLIIFINTANLQQGGALQVAASFVEEASKLPNIEFHIILGKASRLVIDPSEYQFASHLKFHHINVVPAHSFKSFLKYRNFLRRLEKSVNPVGVISVFGAAYWKPNAKHIVGFARPYLIYPDTYFFKVWKDWRSVSFWLSKSIQRYFLRLESRLYWTETENAKKRLALFLNCSSDNIVVASNNCSHYFWETNFTVLNSLPAKKVLRLLYVSSYYPHKGFEMLPLILRKLKEQLIEVELVITIQEEIFARIFKGVNNVINLGAVNPKYCPYLYQESDIVLAPTLLEVFTAIYPEAMHSRKPIVTTDLPFARDICRDAALYFNPSSADNAVEQIKRLINEPGLREQLIEKGLRRLKEFDLPEERFQKLLKHLV